MPDKQTKSPVPAAGSASRSNSANAIMAIAFFVLFAGYFALYLSTELPSGLADSRGAVLFRRIFLPETTAAQWFGWPPSIELTDRLPILLAASGVLVMGWLLGRLLLAVLHVESSLTNADAPSPATTFRFTRVERLVFSCGIGLNTISLYVLAAGLAGALDRRFFVVPAAAIIVLAAWQWWKQQGTMQAAAEANDADGISPHWLWLAAPFAVMILLGGMLPPAFFDVREYHLQAPKEFFQQGSIGFLPHNVYGNMPLGAEMFSLLSMVLLGDWWLGALVGKTVIAAFAPLTALVLFAAGRRFASPGAGIVAAVVYLSTPWVSVVSTAGLIEGVVAFYLFLSLYAVGLWWLQDSGGATARQWGASEGLLALIGFCAGSAVSCKYPAVLFVALPLGTLIVCKSARRPWKPVAIYLAALLAGCGLWLVKNWVLTGNPVYPLLYDWLGGETRTPDINARWLQAHRPHEFGLSSLLESLSKVALKSAWLSPILMPLAVAGLFVRRYRWLSLSLAGYFVYVISAWWLFTHRIDRFWIPALPVLALLAGVGAVWSTSLGWRRAILAMLVVGLPAGFFASQEEAYNRYFVSLLRTRLDPERINVWHKVLNSNVPQGCSVLSVGDAQVFDVEVPIIYSTVFDKSVVAAICQDRSPQEIAAELRRLNISHVYVDWSEIRRYREPGNYGGIPDFVTHEWLANLVNQRVLDPPWQMRTMPNQEVYPVTEVCAAVERRTGAQVVNTAAVK